MDMSLKNREWQEFNVEQIFNINTGANVPQKKLKKGKLPRISAKEHNNGIISFTEKTKHKNYRTLNNFISVSFLGSVFYHPYTASLDMKIHAVKIKHKEFNKYLAGFIVYTLKLSMNNTSYGNQTSSTDLPSKKVFLPINSDGKPDYEFMEAYMRQKEHEKINAYNNYISKRINELKTHKDVVPLSEKDWAEFFLNDIFPEIQRGKRLKKDDHRTGIMPYISSKAANNGIDGFIGNNKKVRIFADCLSIANSGSVGACFYQPFQFIASDHVTKLGNKDFNKNIFLFISTIVSRLGEKYSFNREINDGRIQKEKIMLPINENKEPDYDYMENYMKKLELLKINKYLEYKENTTRH